MKKIKKGKDGGQDGGSKLWLAITQSFINWFGSNLKCTCRIKCQKKCKEW